MSKKRYIWKFTQAGRTPCYNEYCLNQTAGPIKAKSCHFSSLEKCRKRVAKLIEDEYTIFSSKDNWTEENWREDGDYCYVINSGGCTLFSFQKIYYE